MEGMHGLTAEDVNKCQDLDCLSTIVQEGRELRILKNDDHTLNSIFQFCFLVFGMEPAPKGDDFLELWKWYSKVTIQNFDRNTLNLKVRALIGSMQTNAVLPQKRMPKQSMYNMLRNEGPGWFFSMSHFWWVILWIKGVTSKFETLIYIKKKWR